jgi:hypothetical protein
MVCNDKLSTSSSGFRSKSTSNFRGRSSYNSSYAFTLDFSLKRKSKLTWSFHGITVYSLTTSVCFILSLANTMHGSLILF